MMVGVLVAVLLWILVMAAALPHLMKHSFVRSVAAATVAVVVDSHDGDVVQQLTIQ